MRIIILLLLLFFSACGDGSEVTIYVNTNPDNNSTDNRTTADGE